MASSSTVEDRPAPAPPTSPGHRARRWASARWSAWAPSAATAPVWVLAIACLGYVLLVAYLARHLSFFQDDYYIITRRRGWDADTLLSPVNQHLFVTMLLYYKVLFATVGLRTFWPYQGAVIATHVALVVVLYVLASRRAGRWIALAPALLMLVLFAGFENELWSLQVNISGGLAAGMGAIICLQRGDRRGDIWACVLTALAISCFSVCLFLAIAIGIVLAFRNWRRLWIVAVPLLLYALWYAGYGQSDIVWSNVSSVPSYDLHIAGYGFAGLLGLSSTVFHHDALYAGYSLLAAAVAWLVTQLIRRRVTALTVIGVLSALGFWTATALARAAYGEPDASRYVYSSGAFILLAAVGALRPWRVRVPFAVAAALAGVAIAIVGLKPLRDYARERTTYDALVRVQFGAIEVAGPAARPGYVVDEHLLGGITAGDWLGAVRDLGSNAFGVQKIRSMPPWYQHAADRTVIGAERIAPRPAPAPPAAASCSPISPGGPVTVAPGTVVYIRNRSGVAVDLWLRRISRRLPPRPQYAIPAHAIEWMRFPHDASSLPWQLRATSGPAAAAATICLQPVAAGVPTT